MEDDGAPFDSGFDDTGPFRVSPESGGVSLETALRDFGPAAIDDLIPRIRAIANRLDAAHRAGVIHGALHPSKVFVTDEATEVIAGTGAPFDSAQGKPFDSAQGKPFDSAQGKHPYVAPEVVAGHGVTAMSDQYALAAIAYEWMFGRPVAHAGDRPIEVRSMPGVDRPALSKAFTRALAPKPEDRFASCGAFCDALNGAIVPELPLLADVEDFAAEEPDAAPFDSDRENAFLAQDRPFDSDRENASLAQDAPLADDLKIVAEESTMTAAPFDSERANAFLAQDRPFDSERENAFLAQDRPFDSERENAFLAQDRPFDSERANAFLAQDKPFDSEPADAFLAHDKQPEVDVMKFPSPPPPVAPVPSWNPSPAPRVMESPRFGPMALFLAVIVGAVFGFAAGYMARPRALQSGPPQTIATQDASGALGAAPKEPEASAPKAPEAPAPQAPQAPKAPKAPEKPGRLLVRSTPSGASVSVDGVALGETPIALRDLDLGTRNVTIAEPGYKTETRRVSITKTRPARTLDVRLSAAASSAQPAPPKLGAKGASGGGPATLGKPAVSTGTLAVESRPAGAAVTVNGKPSGTTPLTINELPPGEYRIQLTLPGYRTFSTTVRVVAGERVRAAASLTAVEQQ